MRPRRRLRFIKRKSNTSIMTIVFIHECQNEQTLAGLTIKNLNTIL